LRPFIGIRSQNLGPTCNCRAKPVTFALEWDCATQITDENVQGAFGDHTTTHSSPFHGTIDEVIVLSRAATAEEIAGIYALY